MDSGTIPQNCYGLSSLTNIQLASNAFTGAKLTLPYWLLLTYFYCIGSLPSAMGYWTSLITFSVNSNKFNGTLFGQLCKLLD